MHPTIISTIIRESLSLIQLIYKEKNKRLSVKSEDIEDSIANHIHYINNWSSNISFRDLKVPHGLENIYVDLTYQFLPNRLKYENEPTKTITLKKLFTDQNHNIVILGVPGSGKSTTMKKLCHLILYDEYFLPDLFSLPILIRLRDFNQDDRFQLNSNFLYLKIFQILGLKINITQHKDENDKKHEILNSVEIIKKATINFLDSLKALLILDGFDEIYDENIKKNVIEDFKELSLKLSYSRIILTSRTGEFHYNINNTVEFEICKLSSLQIIEFVNKYITDKKRVRKLIRQINDSPYADTASKPLTIAHLCAIFERYGKIPEKPKSVYRKVVNLYLEEWNAQNSIDRISKYGNFEIDRKFEFLCNLSYHLSIINNQFTFSKTVLGSAYREICIHFDLPKNQEQKVIDEIESHTGLFIQTGYESFEFAHKSLQEYLAAEYIVRLPYFFSDKRALSNIPNELALAVALSSNPTNYFADLIIQKLKDYSLQGNFFFSFIQRLIIEKPDFIVSETLAIAYFYLFTLQRTMSMGRNKLKEFLFLMERFSLLNGFQESLKLISSCYRNTTSKNITEDFILISKIEDYKNNDFKDIPKYLFVPRNLISLIT